MINILRAINGIGLNGKEFLLDGHLPMEFENRAKAKEFLRENGYEDLTDDEMEDSFHFEEADAQTKLDFINKSLTWFKAFANQVRMSNHNAYNYACEHADDVTDDTVYPYMEGDDYWIFQESAEVDYDDSTGCYSNGIVAVQSCWDDQSKIFHRENPDREYFNSLEEVLQGAKHQYNFIKIECFDSDMQDIEDGDYFVATDDDNSKYQKSY
tara:strand:+ start:7030 stop:7662 length:633 start_codon:yes stop_codon:yes gene_type:complete